MKTFTKCAAQGDVYFIRVSDNTTLDGYKEVPPESGMLIVTHSETGHHHVMDPTHARMFQASENEYDSILVIDRPTSLDHKRTFDTHESIMFDSGTYKVRRQREYTPEGFRRVED